MRALAVFYEVKPAVRWAVFGERVHLSLTKSGIVLRYWEELFLPWNDMKLPVASYGECSSSIGSVSPNLGRHCSVNVMVKRLVDFLAASVGLMVAGPLMIVVAIGIRATMGSPVLFCQRRPGLDGRVFTLLKFRTMCVDRERECQSQFDAHRSTPLGRILRHTSLDELPQLFNVLRGDMSLVGPRPLLPEYLPYYSEREGLRHTVRPGITGWAQINGRNRLSWDERLALDVWYTEHQSMLLDLRILYLTTIRVLQRRDISPDPHMNLQPLHQERSRSETLSR